MFFALTNAIFDAGIAAWDAKRAYDSVRPVTAISLLFRGKNIHAWGGPEKGTVEMDGSQWIPYQAAAFPTPPFPDFVSGHSTYSAAAARILALWTGSDEAGWTGGIGVVEGSLTLALVAFGGAATLTLAAVLLYRLIAYWSCIPAGGLAWLVLRAMSPPPKSVPEPVAAVEAGEPTREPEPTS